MRIEKDIRYFAARLKSAILVKPNSISNNIVLFGTCVELEDENGKAEYYELVGEDEANINQNKISYISPIAKAIIGNQIGEEILLSKPSGLSTLLIRKITYK